MPTYLLLDIRLLYLLQAYNWGNLSELGAWCQDLDISSCENKNSVQVLQIKRKKSCAWSGLRTRGPLRRSWPDLKKNQMSWPIIPPLFLLGISHSIGLNWLEQINSTCQLQDGCIWHNNVDLKLVLVLIPCLPECNCIVVHTSTSLDSRKMYVTYNEKLINKRFFKN